jgi:DNA repair protein RecN (Recombination protein N)
VLVELKVRNFAIIESVRLNFIESFNVLTGETGAGKSLIIDAILALMGRGGADFVRAGCDKAEVEAVFSIGEISKFSEDFTGEDDFLILKKVIFSNGKSKQYINDSFVTQVKMREVLQKLIHVYGQSEAKELYDTNYHTELYDIFCDNLNIKENLKKLILDARTIKKELVSIEEKEQKIFQEIDFLKFQIEEIERANITSIDEDVQLEHKRGILQNKEKILRGLSQVYSILYGSENSVYDLLSKGLKILSNIPEKTGELEESEKELYEVIDVIKNSSNVFNGYISKLEFESDDVDTVEARLDTLTKLKRKYGGTLENVLTHLRDAKERLQMLENLSVEKKDYLEKLNHLREDIRKTALNLSEKRKKYIRDFEKKVANQLKDLGMAKSEFRLILNESNVSSPEDMPLFGSESVEFYFASHSGEPVRPLSTIASGGELSRIMLAIKNIIPKEKEMTVIFDEVDSGVGGKIGEMLGKKLKEISKHHQVICITHLPQVAVWAEKHIMITKDESGDRVKVIVNELDYEERIYEIARMLGGNLSEKGLEY